MLAHLAFTGALYGAREALRWFKRREQPPVFHGMAGEPQPEPYDPLRAEWLVRSLDEPEKTNGK